MKLRDYQREAIEGLWECWKASPRSIPLIVLPTGAGKSLVIASIIQRISKKYPRARFIIATHTAKIVIQNAQELQSLLKVLEPIGIYSASLKAKTIKRVTFGNVQSMYKKGREFDASFLIIDECHLTSEKDSSMYQQLITGLRIRNPDIKILGLTATPMRMDQGSLVSESSTFNEIAYEVPIWRLIEEGYLAPLISVAKKEVDLSSVHMSGHDYNQHELELAFNQDYLIETQCKEIIESAKDRKHLLIFCTGIEHAKKVSEKLTALGLPTDYVTGEMPYYERTLKLDKFSQGNIRGLCNVDVLTTGYNFKPIDSVVLLRATRSVALYVQCVGRGTRTAPGKNNCLVLDFGGNIDRHGPIDLIQIKAQKSPKAEVGVAPSKKCPMCGCVVAIKTRICPACESEFPISTDSLTHKPSTAQILNEPEELQVIAWKVSRHKKSGKPDSLKITYSTDRGEYHDFLCFDHLGFASQMAQKKWYARMASGTVPTTVDEALSEVKNLSPVVSIRVIKKDKFHEILKVTLAQDGVPITQNLSGDLASVLRPWDTIEPIPYTEEDFY